MLRAPSMPNPKKTIETIDFHGVSIPVEVRVTYRYVAKVAKEYGFGHMSLGSDGEPTEMKLKVGQWADVAFRDKNKIESLTYRLDWDWPVEVPAEIFEEIKVEEIKEIYVSKTLRTKKVL